MLPQQGILPPQRHPIILPLQGIASIPITPEELRTTLMKWVKTHQPNAIWLIETFGFYIQKLYILIQVFMQLDTECMVKTLSSV